MKKRGFQITDKNGSTTLYMVIIEAVVIGIVIAAFFWYVNGVESNSLFEKAYLTRDLALTIEAVSYQPGDIVLYNYSQSGILHAFILDFQDDFISVRASDEDLGVRYPFYKNANDKYFLSKMNPKDSLLFSKCADTISMGESSSCTKRLACKKVQPKDRTVLAIKLSDEKDHNAIAQQIQGGQTFFVKTELTKEPHETANILALKFMNIHECAFKYLNGYAPNEYIIARIPFNDDASRSFACHILSAALKNKPELKVLVVPSQKMTGKNLAVELELCISSTEWLSEAIISGMGGYFA
ncbi:MAG: hypothetical protein QXK37_02280 [Candidatus Woesearchaeota archaeon]